MKVTIRLEREIGGEGEESGFYMYRPYEVWANGEKIKADNEMPLMKLPAVVFQGSVAPRITIVIMED